MIDFGTVHPGTTLYIPFATYDSNDPAASVTLTGLATTDIEIYKDGSTTQRSSDSGYALLDTDGIDFDSTTGIHGISINLADNTDAGFYAAGSQYWVVVASITVDAGTVNFIAATFRIGYPNAILNTTIATLSTQTSFTLTAGPAEDDALNGYEVIIHDVASAVQLGRAVISDYTGASKTVTLAAGTTFTAAASDNIAVLGPSPLMPTVTGRTLDVSAGGEAGLDWANVGTPGSTVSLTATTVATVTTTATATALTQERGKYMHGAVWIGPTANTNTVSYVDGIMTNPVSTVAAAKTVADNLGLKRFWVQAGVTVTLAADYAGYVFTGLNWTLATSGSRSISGSVVSGSTNVSGTFTGASPPYFENCEFGTGGATLPGCNAFHCEFNTGTITLGTGNYDFIDCASVVAGTSTPVFDCASPASAQNISFRRWSGGITLNNISANTTVSIDMVSGGTVTLNGVSGNVQVRGMAATVTDNRTGSPTLGRNAVINQTYIATPTNITAGTITTVSGNVTGSVGSIASGGIVAASFANDAITAAALAADAGTEIGTAVWATTTRQLTSSQTFNVTGNITGNLSGSVGSIATGGIAAASFAAGAIDATAIATGAIDADAIAADAIGASELAADAANEIADALLARNVAGGSSTGRLVKEALYFLRNRWVVSAGTLTVYQTDDTTSSWTSTVTDSASANPVTESNPA